MSIKNKWISIAYLFFTTSIFGLKTPEIDRVTAHLPHGLATSIRKKMMIDESIKQQSFNNKIHAQHLQPITTQSLIQQGLLHADFTTKLLENSNSYAEKEFTKAAESYHEALKVLQWKQARLATTCTIATTPTIIQAPKIIHPFIRSQLQTTRVFGVDDSVIASVLGAIMPTIGFLIAGIFAYHKFDKMIHAEDRANIKILRQDMETKLEKLESKYDKILQHIEATKNKNEQTAENIEKTRIQVAHLKENYKELKKALTPISKQIDLIQKQTAQLSTIHEKALDRDSKNTTKQLNQIKIPQDHEAQERTSITGYVYNLFFSQEN